MYSPVLRCHQKSVSAASVLKMPSSRTATSKTNGARKTREGGTPCTGGMTDVDGSGADSRGGLFFFLRRGRELVGCPGDEFTMDSEMSGSKARHSTLKACTTSPGRSETFCLGQLTRLAFGCLPRQARTTTESLEEYADL